MLRGTPEPTVKVPTMATRPRLSFPSCSASSRWTTTPSSPSLSQPRSVKELHELATSDAYSDITDKLDELDSFPESDDAYIKKRRAELLSDLTRL
jgi:hypothetical protein